MLREIYLKDFRNYSEERVILEQGITVVYGENGQGKTNLLEAIYFAMRGNSFRLAGNRDLVREGADAGVVMARLEARGTGRIVARQIRDDGTTRTKVDGKDVRADLENIVVFSQDDLAVIKGDPQKRREFVDDLAGELDREFEVKNSQFKKAVYQRNETLKRVRRGETGRDALAAWEEILIDRGTYVVKKRKEALEGLASIVDAKLSSSGDGGLRIKYYGTFEGEEDYRNKLEKNREREIARGITITGPHRDEMIFFLADRNLKTKGSQGQQRKAAILFKIACAEMIEEEKKSNCTLLLDDMPSELDSRNTGWLMKVLEDREQTIITINTNRLAELPGAESRLHISGGRVI